MKRLMILIIMGMFLINSFSFASAINCKDSFTSSEIVQVCGYCNEFNGSICLPSRECNITIKYANGTNIVEDVTATNNGDGTILYNISNLSNGDYNGILDCGIRSKDDFSFNIYSPVGALSVSSGGGYWVRDYDFDKFETFFEEYELNRTNVIPKDIGSYFNSLSETLSPKQPIITKIFLILILIIFIFFKELKIFFKKLKYGKK
ncbi:MAG: hypothetical protein J7L15_05780 [Clostridiales bacterium]|nr:hypothetical protein [Clostridiales bacterium]